MSVSAFYGMARASLRDARAECIALSATDPGGNRYEARTLELLDCLERAQKWRQFGRDMRARAKR